MTNQENDKRTIAAGFLAATIGSAALEPVTPEDVLAELQTPAGVVSSFEPASFSKSPTLTLLEKDLDPSQNQDLAKALLTPELLEKITDQMQTVVRGIQPRYAQLARLDHEYNILIPQSDLNEEVVLSKQERERAEQIVKEQKKLSEEIGRLDQDLKRNLEQLIKNSLPLSDSSYPMISVRYPFERNAATLQLPFKTSVYIEDSSNLSNDAAARYVFGIKNGEVAMLESAGQNLDLEKLLNNGLVPNAVRKGLEEMRDQRGFRQLMGWEKMNDVGDASYSSDSYSLAPIHDRLLSATGIKVPEALVVSVRGAGDSEVQIHFGQYQGHLDGIPTINYGSRTMSLAVEISELPGSEIVVAKPVMEIDQKVR